MSNPRTEWESFAQFEEGPHCHTCGAKEGEAPSSVMETEAIDWLRTGAQVLGGVTGVPYVDVAKQAWAARATSENAAKKAAEQGPLLRPRPNVKASGPLPRVLAGPILRRAEPKAVWVWMALGAKPIAIVPRVVPYHSDGTANADYVGRGGSFPLLPPSADDVRTVQVAQKLWVVMVRLRPDGRTFPSDVLLGYTLQIKLEGSSQSFWLHEEIRDLAYKPFELPTFFLSSKPRRIAQGSCRRPGGTGVDAHFALDALMAKSVRKTEERPYALLLTGDQIYADDVAEALYYGVQALARDRFGFDEEVLNGDGTTAGASRFVFGPPRRAFVTKTLGFTTEDGEGHLLSFAEFAAMYLMVWGPAVYGAYDLERADLAATDDAKNLRGFGRSVGASRRIMANIPTYMMFDDHEITDDWNFDAAWASATSKPASQLVIANGLLAYWIFQAWGNDPDGLEPMRSNINAAIASRRSAAGKYRADDKKTVSFMTSTHPWSFVPPIVPQTLVVNTRTQRLLLPMMPAGLVGPMELARIQRLAKEARFRRNELLLLVVATPLLNLPFVDAAAEVARRLGHSKYQDDHELFSDNPASRDYFLDFVQAEISPHSIVAYSGDVHHSFMIQAKFDIRTGTAKAPRRVDVLQITSSPIKNVNGNLGPKADAAEEVLLGRARTSTVEYQPIALKGDLGHHTFIPNNNFCVVDFRGAPAQVETLYVGMDGTSVATANRTLNLRPDHLALELETEDGFRLLEIA